MKNTIETFIERTAKRVGGLNLFSPEDTREFVILLMAGGRKILGIDGIFVSEKETRPSMNDSLLTNKLYEQGAPAADIQKNILQFIDSKMNQENLLFEVIYL